MNVHCSTFAPPALVVMEVSRRVVQKVGPKTLHGAAVHSRSHGVSGQCALSCAVQPDRHRSPVPKTTCMGAGPVSPVRVP